jgi:hypothetical protein
MHRSLSLVVALCSLLACTVTRGQPGQKHIVFLAGNLSHPALKHEYLGGCLLLQKCLSGVPGLSTIVYYGGWPAKVADGKVEDDLDVLKEADAIVVYSDGAERHPLLQGDRLEFMGTLMKKGTGLGLIHWSTEATPDKGEKEFIDWTGGCFEVNWSVNPMWKANFTTIPQHEVTRGVHPFSEFDEWHYHFRFADNREGVTPILSAVAPPSSLKPKDGPRSGNPAVRASVARGDEQPLLWLRERPGGGRGFGFAGGHNHLLWKNDDQRKVVLNSILWIAHMEIPPDGVESTVTDRDLMANVDARAVRKFVSAPAR